MGRPKCRCRSNLNSNSNVSQRSCKKEFNALERSFKWPECIQQIIDFSKRHQDCGYAQWRSLSNIHEYLAYHYDTDQPNPKISEVLESSNVLDAVHRLISWNALDEESENICSLGCQMIPELYPHDPNCTTIQRLMPLLNCSTASNELLSETLNALDWMVEICNPYRMKSLEIFENSQVFECLMAILHAEKNINKCYQILWSCLRQYDTINPRDKHPRFQERLERLGIFDCIFRDLQKKFQDLNFLERKMQSKNYMKRLTWIGSALFFFGAVSMDFPKLLTTENLKCFKDLDEYFPYFQKQFDIIVSRVQENENKNKNE